MLTIRSIKRYSSSSTTTLTSLSHEDADTTSDCSTQTPERITIPKRSLFKSVPSAPEKPALTKQASKSGAVTFNGCPDKWYYFVTFNLCPDFYCNHYDREVKGSNIKKKFKDHSPDIQKKILSSIHNKFLSNNNKCKELCFSFEMCPTLLQIHLHVVLWATEPYFTEIHTHYNQYTPKKGNDTWRSVDIQRVDEDAELGRVIKYVLKHKTI